MRPISLMRPRQRGVPAAKAHGAQGNDIVKEYEVNMDLLAKNRNQRPPVDRITEGLTKGLAKIGWPSTQPSISGAVLLTISESTKMRRSRRAVEYPQYR